MRAGSILTVLIAIFAIARTSWGIEWADLGADPRRGNLFYKFNSEIPFTGIATQDWSNGQRWTETNILNGKKHGKETYWYDSGQTWHEAEWRDNKRNGKYTKWYENGNKESEGEYRNDKMHGFWTHYYLGGQKKMEQELSDGERISMTNWDQDGLKTEVIEYRNDKISRWIRWNNQTIISAKCWDENGNSIPFK